MTVNQIHILVGVAAKSFQHCQDTDLALEQAVLANNLMQGFQRSSASCAKEHSVVLYCPN